MLRSNFFCPRRSAAQTGAFRGHRGQKNGGQRHTRLHNALPRRDGRATIAPPEEKRGAPGRPALAPVRRTATARRGSWIVCFSCHPPYSPLPRCPFFCAARVSEPEASGVGWGGVGARTPLSPRTPSERRAPRKPPVAVPRPIESRKKTARGGSPSPPAHRRRFARADGSPTRARLPSLALSPPLYPFLSVLGRFFALLGVARQVSGKRRDLDRALARSGTAAVRRLAPRPAKHPRKAGGGGMCAGSGRSALALRQCRSPSGFPSRPRRSRGGGVRKPLSD